MRTHYLLPTELATWYSEEPVHTPSLPEFRRKAEQRCLQAMREVGIYIKSDSEGHTFLEFWCLFKKCLQVCVHVVCVCSCACWQTWSQRTTSVVSPALPCRWDRYIVHSCAHQASWPSSLWGFSWLLLHLTVEVLWIQMCTVKFCLDMGSEIQTQVLTLVWKAS